MADWPTLSLYLIYCKWTRFMSLEWFLMAVLYLEINGFSSVVDRKTFVRRCCTLCSAGHETCSHSLQIVLHTHTHTHMNIHSLTFIPSLFLCYSLSTHSRHHTLASFIGRPHRLISRPLSQLTLHSLGCPSLPQDANRGVLDFRCE